MVHRLHLAFEDLDAFRAEFERNIAMGGAFICTSDPFELRSFLELVIELPFCDKSVILEAEVVHLMPAERALHPGDVGIAVSFRTPASELRAMFKGYLENPTAGFTATAGMLDEAEATAVDDTLVDLPMEKPGSSADYPPSTRFDVFLDGIETAGLSEIEASMVELAGAGLEVARMLEIIPAESVDIHRTIDTLVERGVLKIRGADDR